VGNHCGNLENPLRIRNNHRKINNCGKKIDEFERDFPKIKESLMIKKAEDVGFVEG